MSSVACADPKRCRVATHVAGSAAASACRRYARSRPASPVVVPATVSTTTPQDEYRGQHTAPRRSLGYGASLDSLSDAMDGVYEHPEWYSGEPVPPAETVAQIRSVRGRPDAAVTVYRGVPRGVTTISPGDWVTISREYAEAHVADPTDPDSDGDVLVATVRAGDLWSSGDELNEFGYDPVDGDQEGEHHADPEPEPVTVTSARGFAVAVTPGLLDDQARFAYTNGQCVALAVELARSTGADSVQAILDEDGAVLHAYVLTPDGDALDVQGTHDPDGMFEAYVGSDDPEDDSYESGIRLETFYLEPSADDDPDTVAWLILNSHLRVQDFDLARSFVEPVLRQTGLHTGSFV